MAKDKCATVKGIFLAPGVSRNGRLYTAKNITAAVNRMNAKLAAGDDMPLNMATGHGAADSDDALSTIGRIAKVSIDQNHVATFEADIADTTAGRDIAALVTPKNPYIRGVSIRGGWVGDMRAEQTEEGVTAITADDIDIAGIDFTGRPGVNGAIITRATLSESALAADQTLIYESVESVEFIDEAGGKSTKAPYGKVAYADPGYQSDGQKRYPIDTAAHARAAWSYINVAKNAAKYTPAQVAAMKTKIKRACKKFGIDITQESAQLADEITEILEAYASVCLDNGAATINVSGYTDDAGKLAPLAERLAMAAMAALACADPDEDGDVDLTMADGTRDSSSSYLPTKESSDNDDDMEPRPAERDDTDEDTVTCPVCGDDTTNAAIFCPSCGKQLPQAESVTPTTTTQIQEAIVPEATPTETVEAAAPAAATAEPVAAPEAAAPVESVTSLTTADIAAIGEASATALAAALAPMLAALTPAAAPVEAAPAAPAPVAEAAAPEAAPAAPAAEAVAPVEEATYSAAEVDAKIQAAVEAATQSAVESFRAGNGHRKGFVSTNTVQTAADLAEGGTLDPKALAEMDQETFKRVQAEAWATQPYNFARGTKAIAAA